MQENRTIHDIEILILDNENIISPIFAKLSYKFEAFELSKDTVNIIKTKKNRFDLVIANLDAQNFNLFKANINMPSIIVTDNFEIAINVMQSGSYTCMLKTQLDNTKFQIAIENLFKINCKIKNIAAHGQEPIIAKSNAMQFALKQLKQLKNANSISLTGETGTGKKFLSINFAKQWNRNYHMIDCKNDELMPNLNCIERIIESEKTTTLLINHPEQLNQNEQNILFNLMQSTIGNSKIQWISVINDKDIHNLISNLLERLTIFTIAIPNLEQRAADFSDIVKIFQKSISQTLNKKPRKLKIDELQLQQWPGNFKQLKLYIEKLFYVNNEIEIYLPNQILLDDIFMTMNLKDATHFFQKTYLQKKIAQQQGVLHLAAQDAEINRTTLYRILQKK